MEAQGSSSREVETELKEEAEMTSATGDAPCPPKSNEELITIMSWNINGIRTHDMKKLLHEKLFNCELAAVQETKISRDKLTSQEALVDDYASFFSFNRAKSGYSGVGTYAKSNFYPIAVEEGLNPCTTDLYEQCEDCDEESATSNKGDAKYTALVKKLRQIKFDSNEGSSTAEKDGRSITSYHILKPSKSEEYLVLAIINVYCPRWRNCPDEEVNTEYKLKFHQDLLSKMRSLKEHGFMVLLLGDLNVQHTFLDQSDIDDPKAFVKTPFRDWMDEMLGMGFYSSKKSEFVDVFRNLNKNRESAFTCWNTRLNARETNYGSRIDYTIVDKRLMKYVFISNIYPHTRGSDHCPISIIFHGLNFCTEKSIPACAANNYPEFVGHQPKLDRFLKSREELLGGSSNGSNIGPFNTQDSPPSRKRAPEPRTLMSYFTKKPKAEVVEPSISDPPPDDDAWVTPSQTNSFYKDINNKSAEKWKNIFQAPKAPKCTGHNQDCVFRQTKKKGPNFGRMFWACPRGSGRSDDPNANCGFFKWGNDKS